MTKPKPKPKKRRGRVHAICAKCYRHSPLQREAIPVPLPLCYGKERCCFCTRSTVDGIYVRTLRCPRYRCCKPNKVYPTHGTAAKPDDDHYRTDGTLYYAVIRRHRESDDLREVVDGKGY